MSNENVKKCSKCGCELKEETENGLCEECSKKRRKKIKNTAVFLVGSTAVVIGSIVYIKNNPEAFEELKSSIRKIPSFLKDSRKEVKLLGKGKETFAKMPLLLKKGHKKEIATPNPIAPPSLSSPTVSKDYPNYLTDIDQKKIDMALEKGIFDKNVVKRGKPGWEYGFTTVDELLRAWGATDIIDSFPKWRDHTDTISREQFKEIIKKAAENVPRIKDAELCGDNIHITVKSSSGKTSWGASLNFFDENGMLTSKCQISSDYPEGNAPRFFADEIRKQMKLYIETQCSIG